MRFKIFGGLGKIKKLEPFLAKRLATLPELDTTGRMRLLGLSLSYNRVGSTIVDAPCATVHGVCLLVAPLASSLDISSTGAAAAQSHLHQPREDGHGTRDPHECEHGRADLGADVQFCYTTDSVAEDDEHDCCEDRGDGDEERVQEGEDGDRESQPTREDGYGHDEDEDK